MLPGVSTLRYLRFRLFLTIWQSVRFRYLALWAATYPKASVLLAVSALLAIFYRLVERAARWLWQLHSANPSWSSLTKAAAALFLVGLFAWAFSVRKRVFVASFEDYTGDGSLKDFVAGLPPMLLNELGRIRKLHEDVTESGASTSGGTTIAASISVQNVGETLESAVSKDSKVKLGFLEIPIGAALGVFGKIMQGPKLSGSVHKQENVVTLIARMEGGGFPSTDWRVDTRDLNSRDSADTTPMLTLLVQQLAYRVFTDLVPTGSTRWEAVCAFSQGLKHLRVTTRTDTDKPWHLRQAEASFIEAVAKDNKFGSCHYNLGVVYEGLNQPDSAKEAYATAIKQKPEFAPSYYALALNRWTAATPRDLHLYCECIRFCDQAISLNLDYARAWSLKGLAYRKMREAVLPAGTDAGPDVFKESNKSRAVAAAVAWRAACKSTLAGRPDKSAYANSIAVNCLRNFAVGRAMLGGGKGDALFAQALYLKPADADLHFEFGKTLCRPNKLRAAVRQFLAAATIEGKPLHWAWLAGAQSRINLNQADVRESLGRALQGSRAGDDTRKEIDKSCGNLAPGNIDPAFVSKIDKAQEIAAELELITKPQEEPFDYVKRIEQKLPKDSRKGWDFSPVIAAIQAPVADEELKKLVGSAANRLVRDSNLYGMLAFGYMDPRRNEPEAALPHAERAVVLNPLAPWERSILAQVYSALGDYEQAEAEWKTCLDLAPIDPDVLQNVAGTYWNRGVYRLQPERRREMFERVIENYRRVLKISENQVLSQVKDEREGQMLVRGGAHFWLGRFHEELLQYDDAVSELMKAKGLHFKPLESSAYLGWTYVEAKAYDKAEDALREGLRGGLREGLRRQIKTLRSLRMRSKKEHRTLPFSQPAQMPGEDRPMGELLVRIYFSRALACVGSGMNLDKAVRLGQMGFSFLGQVEASKHKELKAIYHLILGSVALKSGKIDLAIEELERSIGVNLGMDANLRLAEAYLARAQSDKGNWAQWIGKARDSLQFACAEDVRGRSANDLASVKARVDAVEQENKAPLKSKKPEQAKMEPEPSPSEPARI